MRYKEPFTLFIRTLKSGLRVYYYRYYTLDGQRTGDGALGKSTKPLRCNMSLTSSNLDAWIHRTSKPLAPTPRTGGSGVCALTSLRRLREARPFPDDTQKSNEGSWSIMCFQNFAC